MAGELLADVSQLDVGIEGRRQRGEPGLQRALDLGELAAQSSGLRPGRPGLAVQPLDLAPQQVVAAASPARNQSQPSGTGTANHTTGPARPVDRSASAHPHRRWTPGYRDPQHPGWLQPNHATPVVAPLRRIFLRPAQSPSLRPGLAALTSPLGCRCGCATEEVLLRVEASLQAVPDQDAGGGAVTAGGCSKDLRQVAEP